MKYKIGRNRFGNWSHPNEESDVSS
jgi:hypothetical protein